MENVIELSHVTKDYGAGKGIFDISFQVKRGEVFGYLGPNGAGKSTTIRQIMGFIRPQSGTCTVLGLDCFSQASQVQKHIGYLPGEISFFDDMSGTEYLDFIGKMKRITNQARRNYLTELFELNPKGKIRKMSKGMKQKIGLIVAFMGEPEVLILDEPTSGLDPLMQNRFVQLILEEKKKGTTILMSSHIFEEVEKTCDSTAMIRQGKIVDTINIATLSKMKSKRYCVTLATKENAQALAREAGNRVLRVYENQVDIKVQEDLAQILSMIAKYQPISLEIESQTLEDLFLHHYGKEKIVRD